MAAHHSGDRNQADVLTERCVGKPAEHTGNRGAKAIGIGCTSDFLVCCLAARAAFADAADIAHGFNRGNDRHKAHADDDGAVEFEPPFERHWRCKHGGAPNVCEIHLTHHQGDDIACDQTHKNGRDRDQSPRKEFDRQGYDDHHKRGKPHGERSEFRFADQWHAARRVLDAHLDQ